MVIFLHNLYISVWIQHFWGSPLNCLISEPSDTRNYNESSYKQVPVYRNILYYTDRVPSKSSISADKHMGVKI